MFATAALAVLAENHPHLSSPAESLSKRATSSEIPKVQMEEGGTVLEKIVSQLGQLLEDKMEHVRVPAAITFYCIGRETQKVE